ncbi:hypothetical protein J6590_058106 [Homalodisca vitripennis]|nr:hypothetical protein J6590_058106 [Homalodisca vitripennis]
MDLKKKHVEWDFLIPKLMILGDYIASGKVLVLPISGNGKGNITLHDEYPVQGISWSCPDMISCHSSEYVANRLRGNTAPGSMTICALKRAFTGCGKLKERARFNLCYTF